MGVKNSISNARSGTVSVFLVLLCALIGSPAAGSETGIQGAQAIAIINQQRQNNGIPPITTVDQTYAAWCPEENTAARDGGDALRDVSPSETWSTDSTPWTNAPLHELAMYDPAMVTAGDVDVAGNACLGLGGDANQPASGVTFYAFIWEGGTTNVPTSETVSGEMPYAPQQLAGIPDGQATGPQPLLYPEGLGQAPQAVSWSLTTAAGAPVPNVKFVDDADVVAGGYPAWALSLGGVMIPPVLEPGTTYDGTVVWQGPGDGTSMQTFSFTTTTATAIATATNEITVRATPVGTTVKISVESSAPSPILTITGARDLTSALNISGRATAVLTAGTWRACVSSGGGTSGYQQAQQCTEITIKPPPAAKRNVARSASVPTTADAG